MTDDLLFRALADPTRREMLDRLRLRNGQTLTELCGEFAMTRQSATQHLDTLEAANLIITVKRGREKLHYLNPVPIHEIQERWIAAFERPRLRALHSVKQKAEATVPEALNFVYVTYIRSTPEAVWTALTDADITAQYWGHSNVSDWLVGSRWEHRRTDGSGVADCLGTVLESTRPVRLVTTWEDPTAAAGSPASRVTFSIEANGELVRLTVTHEELPDEHGRGLAAKGWAAVVSNLKSLLETGQVLPSPPWEMP